MGCAGFAIAGHLGTYDLQQTLEQLEGLALVFLLRVLLRIAAQVDALAQVVQRDRCSRQ
jgi:hypothetical protein